MKVRFIKKDTSFVDTKGGVIHYGDTRVIEDRAIYDGELRYKPSGFIGCVSSEDFKVISTRGELIEELKKNTTLAIKHLSSEELRVLKSVGDSNVQFFNADKYEWVDDNEWSYLCNYIYRINPDYNPESKKEPTLSDFQNAVQPLMQYLAENHHPHTSVTVEANKAILWEGLKTHTTDEFIVD